MNKCARSIVLTILSSATFASCAGSKVSPPAHFTVQIAAYKIAAEGEDQIARLKKKGVDGAVSRVQLANGETRYRVHIGDYPSKEEADAAGAQLRAAGKIDAYLVWKRVLTE